MNTPFKGLSILQKFLIMLSVIFALALVEYQSFLNKSRQVEVYDDLHSRISSTRVSIAKIEYLLDMFVVARRFEYGTINIIKSDVDELNEGLRHLVESPAYRQVWQSDSLLADGIRAIGDDWTTIKAEIRRLDMAMSQDEVMLIHNAVDMNTIMVTEKAERLLSVISERRQSVFREFEALALMSVAGVVLITLFMSLLLYRYVFYPLSAAGAAARSMLSGEKGLRFRQDHRSSVGRLGAELNMAVEHFEGEIRRRDSEREALAGTLADMAGQISAIREVADIASRSLSEADVHGIALQSALSGTGANACALYAPSDDAFRLKASSGLDADIAKQAQTVRLPPAAGDGPRVYAHTADLPDSALACTLGGVGVQSVVSVPLMYDRAASGLLLVMYKDGSRLSAEHLNFLTALASSLAAISGHSCLYQRELHSRRFLERAINQMPHGLGVFDRDGMCLLMNAQAKKMLGAEPRFDHCRYSVLDDEALRSQGALQSIRRAYEGYSTEFVIEYSPMSTRTLGLSALPRRLRLRSLPLYDSGGEISSMALIYEDLTEAHQPSAEGHA